MLLAMRRGPSGGGRGPKGGDMITPDDFVPANVTRSGSLSRVKPVSAQGYQSVNHNVITQQQAETGAG